jgi:hypothetical protein
MGNETDGKEMNENPAADDNRDTASGAPVRIKTGKSLVTLKDRALLNAKLANKEAERKTLSTQWRFETNGEDP